MGGRARHALISLALAASAQRLAAQNPPPAATPAAARDSMAREQILNEIIPVGATFAPRVTLIEGTVYRVEIQPASATFSVRSARRPSLPPLFLIPLGGGGPPGVSQTAAFLLVPRSTEEYRFDVAAYGTEPVRLRVETDPREMARYTRMREATKNLSPAGLSLRAVYLGAFIRPQRSDLLDQAGSASATGVEACFALVPRGAWSFGRLGGCALSIARYQRPDPAGGMWFVGTEPAYVLSRPGATIETSIVATLGIGAATPPFNMDYLDLGLGFQVATGIPGLGRHWHAEAEAGFARLQELGNGLEPKGRANIVPHLGLGLQFRL